MDQGVYLFGISPSIEIAENEHMEERGGEAHVSRVLCLRGRSQASMTNSFLADVMPPHRSSVCFCGTAEQASQRERLDPLHLLPPWHLVHLGCGPVVIPGERLRFVPDQKIPGKQVGLSQSPLDPQGPRDARFI